MHGDPTTSIGVMRSRQLEMLTEISPNADSVGILNVTPILANEIAQGNRVYGRMDINLGDNKDYVVARVAFNRLMGQGLVGRPIETPTGL